MCGIAGLVFSHRDPLDVADAVESMLTAMAHRGPDGREVHSGPLGTIGSAQLSIVGRSEMLEAQRLGAEASVVANRPGHHAAVLNGELYGELCSSGPRRPRRLGGASRDTEWVLDQYLDAGTAALVALRGEFALAFLDGRRSSLVLVRDPFGAKPLYWARAWGGIAFASEVRALMALSEISTEIDLRGVAEYLTFRAARGERTLTRDVARAPAGAAIEFREGRPPMVTRLWDLRSEMARGPAEPDQLAGAIERSIGIRVPDEDVPFGVFLSGGVDSGLVARLAAERRTPVTYTASFSDPEVAHLSQGGPARRTAEELGAEHHEVVLTEESYWRHLVLSAMQLDQPSADPAIPAFSHLCEAAADTSLVILSGEGSDEIFSSYGLYSELENSSDPYWCFGRLLTDDVREEMLPTLHDALGGGLADDVRMAWDAMPPQLSQRHRFLLADADAWLSGCLLARLDALTMARGVEARVPYLDWDVVSLAVRDQRFGTANPDKPVVRSMLRAHGGGDLADAPKMGLAMPTGTWLRARPDDVRAIVLEGRCSEIFPLCEIESFLELLLISDDSLADQTLFALVVLSLYGGRG